MERHAVEWERRWGRSDSRSDVHPCHRLLRSAILMPDAKWHDSGVEARTPPTGRFPRSCCKDATNRCCSSTSTASSPCSASLQRGSRSVQLAPGRRHLALPFAHAAAHLLALRDEFELVWCTGWEETANEHLPARPRARSRTPTCRSATRAGRRPLEARRHRRPRRRPAARLDRRRRQRRRARRGRSARAAPTLLVETEPATRARRARATPSACARWAQALDVRGPGAR